MKVETKVQLIRLKWLVLGLTGLALFLVELFYCVVRNVPMIEDTFDWLVGMAIAFILIHVSFRIVFRIHDRAMRLYHKAQQELTEHKQTEKMLRESQCLSMTKGHDLPKTTFNCKSTNFCRPEGKMKSSRKESKQDKLLQKREERLDEILKMVDEALVKIKEAIELDIRSLREQMSNAKGG